MGNIPMEVQEQIMNFAGYDHIYDEGSLVKFNEKNSKIYNRKTIFFYVPRQVAGFGFSMPYVYKLEKGLHDKEMLVQKLLSIGYFGERDAKMIANGWNQHKYLIIELKGS